MKINIENCIRHCGATGIYKYSLNELLDNLKELKKRGDKQALDEFFNLYKFDHKPLDE